jgi:hypothetical protein
MSRATTRRSRSDSGASPETIRWARPSTIAASRVGAELVEHRDDDALGVLEQPGEQVLGGDLRVAALVGQPGGGGHCFLRANCQAVGLHKILVTL